MTEPTQDCPLEIDVHAVRSLFDAKQEFLLLDCREPSEHELVKIQGATLIPMGEIPQRVDELAGFRDKRIVVHCHHGGRSLMVTQWLRDQGFIQAQNMAGGIDAWSLEIDRSLPRY